MGRNIAINIRQLDKALRELQGLHLVAMTKDDRERIQLTIDDIKDVRSNLVRQGVGHAFRGVA